jgi:hypothetical protein
LVRADGPRVEDDVAATCADEDLMRIGLRRSWSTDRVR